MIHYVYDPEGGIHPIGTVEQMADGRWRACTRNILLGTEFPDRESAIEAVHEDIDRGGDR